MAESQGESYRFTPAGDGQACKHVYKQGEFELSFQLMGGSVLIMVGCQGSSGTQVAACIVPCSHLTQLAVRAGTVGRPEALTVPKGSDAHIHGEPVAVLLPATADMPTPVLLFSDERWWQPGQGYVGYAMQAREVACVPLGRDMNELAKEMWGEE